MNNRRLVNPRTDLDRVYSAIVDLEKRLDRPVSRHEIAEALAQRGVTVRSLDGLVWHLEIINHIWRSGFGQRGKNGRRARLYTTRFRLTRPRNQLNVGKIVPPEIRRAVRDVASALRGAAEALNRLDELADGDVARPRERAEWAQAGVTSGDEAGAAGDWPAV